jgi:hypothetical protein
VADGSPAPPNEIVALVVAVAFEVVAPTTLVLVAGDLGARAAIGIWRATSASRCRDR